MHTREDIAIHLLSAEADRCATFCPRCAKFGHSASDCPKLAHVTEPGIRIEAVETARFNRAFDRSLLLLGFLMGVGITKMFEWAVAWLG